MILVKDFYPKQFMSIKYQLLLRNNFYQKILVEIIWQIILLH